MGFCQRAVVWSLRVSLSTVQRWVSRAGDLPLEQVDWVARPAGGACVAAAAQGGGRAAGARDPTSIANQERSGGVRPRGHSPGVATARRASE